MSVPQRSAVGANEPGWYRLYELTFGAYQTVNCRMVASIPASACRISADMPCPGEPVGSGPAPNTGSKPSSVRSEKWMWQELPSRSFGLAMKVSAIPSWAAISLAPVL